MPINPYAIIRDGLNAPDVFPQEILDYMMTVDTGNTVYTQKLVSAYVTGSLFDLPAGSIGAVLGVEARRESIDDQPGWDMINDNLFDVPATGITRGTDTVRELFAELEVPLLRNARAARDLTLNLAGRYSNYDTAGSDTTYRAGLNWQIIDQLRLRSSYGTSFRAPALYESFLGGQSSERFVFDPCEDFRDTHNPGDPVYDNCLSEIGDADHVVYRSSHVVTYGNAGRIRPETSESRTLGLVLELDVIDLSIALDWFEFTIEDEIGRYGADSIVSQCYSLVQSEFRQPGTICDYVSERGDDLIFEEVNDSYFNINEKYQEGIDLTMRFAFEAAALDFVADLRATRILDFTEDLFGGEVRDHNGRIAFPDVNGQLDLRAMTNHWTCYYGLDYIGGGSDYSAWEQDPETSIYILDTGGVTYHNLGLRYAGDGWSAQVGVNNIADKEPPRVSGAIAYPGNAAINSSYDRLGRTYFLGFSRDFEGS